MQSKFVTGKKEQKVNLVYCIDERLSIVSTEATTKIVNDDLGFTTPLLRPQAMAAAVGSLMIRRTWRPVMAPPSLVA